MQNSQGCDSIITLILIITEVDTDVSVAGNVITSSALGATYQWIDCNRITDPELLGETGQSFTALENGNFAVIVLQNGCSDTSDCVEITHIGIAENLHSLEAFHFYPNPTTGNVFIYAEEVAGRSVSIIVRNIIGKTVFSEAFEVENHFQKEISLTGIPAGIYFVEVEDSRGKSIKRLVMN